MSSQTKENTYRPSKKLKLPFSYLMLVLCESHEHPIQSLCKKFLKWYGVPKILLLQWYSEFWKKIDQLSESTQEHLQELPYITKYSCDKTFTVYAVSTISGVARLLATPGHRLGTPAMEVKMRHNHVVNIFNRSPSHSGLCTKSFKSALLCLT